MKERETQIATETAQSAVQTTRARRLKYIERAFTLAAILVVIILGWSAISGFAALFRKSPEGPANTDVSRLADIPAAPEPLLDFSRGGHWEMAGWNWKIGLSSVSDAELESRWSELASQPLPSDLSDAEKQAVDRLLEGIRKLPVKTAVDGSTTSYTLDQDSIRIRVVSRREGDRESVVGMSAAVRRAAEGTWSLMTLESRPAGSLNSVKHIMPLPQGTVRLSGRTDESGQIVFEIVESPFTLSALVDYWKETGWEQQPGAGVVAPEKNFLFARNGTVVQAWQVPGENGSAHRIALMKVSDDTSGSASGSPEEISVTERASQ